MDETKYWVAFNKVKGVGAVRFKRLLNHFGKLSLAWQAPGSALKAAGLTGKVLEQIELVRSQLDLDAFWLKIQEREIRVLTWEDPQYPQCLKEIDQPPPVIYLRGSLLPVDGNAVAIVGTRRVTSYGRQITEDTSRYLAGNGVTIVSGLARGVDALAHQTALEIGGRTIAVLGSGVDIIYPPEHRKLANEIIANGAIMSDYAPGTPPDGMNFPPRNRIISGLSKATIVIEAGQSSGALITAKFAIEQGRDVFAVPGSILSPMSRGTNQLICDGAIPLTNPRDVLELLGMDHVTSPVNDVPDSPLEPIEAKIILAMGNESIHVDEICEMLDIPIHELTAKLTLMELKGLVKQSGDMHYLSVRNIKHD